MTTLWIDIPGRTFVALALAWMVITAAQIVIPAAVAAVVAFNWRAVKAFLCAMSLDDFDSERDDDGDKSSDDADADDDAWDRGHDQWADRVVGL